MQSKRRIQSGLSMLEVVITMFLVMVGLLVVMSSFVAIARSGRYGQDMDTATNLARMEMERVRNMPYANIQSVTGADNEYPDYPGYHHKVTVATIGSVKEVVLDVYFHKNRRRAEVRTYVTNL